jgi:hypothetical protein
MAGFKASRPIGEKDCRHSGLAWGKNTVEY